MFFVSFLGIRNKTIWLILFLFGIFISEGCHKNKSELIIGFSQCTGDDGWRQLQLNEMKMELAYHPNTNLIYRDAKEDNEKQIQQIKELLSKKIDVLIVSPNEGSPLTPIINKIYESGIPVIIVDRKTTDTLYTSYVGADNKKVGLLAGEYIGNILNGKGKVVEIQGLRGSTPTIERHEGLLESLNRFPNIQIIKTIQSDWTGPTTAQKLESSKDVVQNADLVFAQNDVMANAAYKVYQLWRISQSVKFIGVDASPGPSLGLSWINKGILTSSVLYPTGGKEAIRAAIDAVEKKSINKNIELETLVIDSINAGLMTLQTNKILEQQKDIEKQQSLLKEQLRLYKSQKILLLILLSSLLIAIALGAIVYSSFKRNKRITKSLRSKNKEILLQQQKLIELSQKAKEANEAKFNFFTNISHELRTPLTLILASVEEIHILENKKTKYKIQIDSIERNTQILLNTINQLLDYEKIETNKINIRVERQDITSYIDDIVNSYRALAQKREIDFRFLPETRPLYLWFDSNLIDKVFFNLLSNAFKFVENYGKISLKMKVDKANNNLIIDLVDNGSGISEKDRSHIFDSFFQGENNPKDGFGLGLPFALDIIRLHHGKLEYSPADGGGAKFTITLSLEKDKFSKEELSDSSSQIISDMKKKYLSSSSLTPAHKKIEEENEISWGLLKDSSILIIEDNEELLELLSVKLKTSFNVFKTKDAEEGLKKAFNLIPDLIICDIMLPSKDGISFTKLIKENIRTSHIPIILLTAKDRLENKIEGIKAKADYYIVKPFHFEFLYSIINSLIKNRIALREHYSLIYDNDAKLEKKDDLNNIDRRFLNELNAYIDENINNEKLSINNICKHIGISRVQLYRKVKALLGCGVNDLILGKRLNRAKFLLSGEDGSNLTISEVSYLVGFSSLSYFSTAFKKKFNLPPSEWRERNS